MKLKTVHMMMLTCISLNTFAYELTTHSLITNQAINRSRLVQDSRLQKDLGLDTFATTGLGQTYFDRSGNAVGVRSVDDYEAAKFAKTGAKETSIPGWILRGAVREDDLTPFGCFVGNLIHFVINGECNPQDDPFGGIDRVLNHFYDPYKQTGLTSRLASGIPSPNWALGTTNAFAARPQPDPGRRNHFSVLDARQAMYYALTGSGPGANDAREEGRKIWWATTFRAVGDVMHLLQDTAQPQHTRNEPHPDSLLEEYIEKRAQGVKNYSIKGRDVPILPLNFDGYPTVRFDRYSAFFATNPGPTALQGKGLAEYSNRGFFTPANNFQHRAYPAPSVNRTDYVEERNTFDDLGESGEIVSFLRGKVPDSITGGVDEIRMTTESALSDSFFVPMYSLNRYNFDDQVNLLLPRAVGYSAGLIDYFFRGQIDLVTDDAMPGQYKIKNLGDEPLKGRFALYHDDEEGIRRPTENVWMLEIPAHGESESLVVKPNPAPPGNPDEETTDIDGDILVFNGDMGEEKQEPGSVGAVTAKVVEDPLTLKFTRVAYFYSPPSGPGGTPFSELLASVELPQAADGGTPRLIEVIRAGKHDMHVKFKSARGEESFPCKNFDFYGPDNINQFCYNFRDPSINIQFNFEDLSYGDNSNSFLKPFFDYNSFGEGDSAAEMTFYIGDAVLFSFKFDPETLADFSPVTFTRKFHVNTKEQVNLKPGERF